MSKYRIQKENPPALQPETKNEISLNANNEHTSLIKSILNNGKYSYNKSAISNPLLQQFMGDGTSTKRERKQGAAFSNVDLMKMQWDYSQAQEERQYNEYLYNQYESPAAQMRQYQQAGLNPALMYQGATGGQVASSHNAPTSAGIGNGTQEVTGFDAFDRIIGMITGAMGIKNQIDATRSQIALNESAMDKNAAEAERARADARKTGKEADRYDEVTDANIAEVRSRIKNTDIDSVLKASQASLNQAHEDLTISQTETEKSKRILMDFQGRLASAQADQINRLLPFQMAYQAAETALAEAKTTEAYNDAALSHQNAQKALLECMKESKLIDEGYYDELIKQNEAQTELVIQSKKMNRQANIRSWVELPFKAVGDVLSVVNKVN